MTETVDFLSVIKQRILTAKGNVSGSDDFSRGAKYAFNIMLSCIDETRRNYTLEEFYND